jgi:hypothetical protein
VASPEKNWKPVYSSYLDKFSARRDDELSITKGDLLYLIERDDEFGDGWYLGRELTSGRVGLFPACE